MPHYANTQTLHAVGRQLRQAQPLVIESEVLALRHALAEVAAGRAFLLQGGDCAESFDTPQGKATRDTYRVLLQMAVILTYAAAQPIVKVGRIAGQYAKPRSSDTETQGDVSLPSYRGDIINGSAFTAAARQPDPERMLSAYAASASTLNFLRALAKGGFSNLQRLHDWTSDFVDRSPQGQRYRALADKIGEALAFMRACGFDPASSSQLQEVSFYTSHEALLLPYEEALTRITDTGHAWYASSAHMLWLGERTRQPRGAHVEYLRGVINPVGVKIGPTATAADVLELIETLNPEQIPGKLLLITRMGAGVLPEKLPPLLHAVQTSGHPVSWVCDPMHGNTLANAQGVKTRDFSCIMQEVQEFFAAHQEAGTVAGGLHIELTGQDVTECRGGGQQLSDTDLALRYTSACDPRLNGSQSLELAFEAARFLKNCTSARLQAK